MDRVPLTIDLARRANLDYHHGGLSPARGVQSFQVLRANREHPEEAEDTGWTYNHAPMLAWWKGRFFLEYLSNPVEEHVAPGHTLLTTSDNGVHWVKPKVVFPVYEIPSEGNPLLKKRGIKPPPQAIMHQRMGFHVAPNGRLLILGFYGFSPCPHDLPFNERGIGRVVREIYEDGSFGPIYFIRIQEHAGWNEQNVRYPLYSHSEDAGFREACESVLGDPLVVQQWKEENGDPDPLIRLKGNYKALSWYTLDDSRVLGLWKWCQVGISRDRGESWESVGEISALENGGGKIWAQRTSDDRYALVYNPTTNNKHRWPLAVTTSENGFNFGQLQLVQGRVPPRRYWGGAYKDYGSNYVRGIVEGNGLPPDGALWVAYSMNKEDIWVSRIPVPVESLPCGLLDDDFSRAGKGPIIANWNTYAPLWAPVHVVDWPDGEGGSLCLEDADPWDAAVAERLFSEATDGVLTLTLHVSTGAKKPLYIELWDSACQIPIRVVLEPEGNLYIHHGRKTERIASFPVDSWFNLDIRAFSARHRFEVSIDGNLLGQDQLYQGEAARDAGWYYRASAGPLERLVLRTGPILREPHIDQTVQEGGDLPGAGERLETTRFHVRRARFQPV